MAGFSIDDFRANFQGGYRPYLFYIYINNPYSSLGMDRTTYLVSASSYPGSTITPIETQWQGQTYKTGSVQTFDDWSCTFRVDTDATVRSDFKAWMNVIHNPITNESGLPSNYLADQTIQLLNNEGNAIKTMTLVGAWPTSLGEITLESTPGEIATFEVTFSYQYVIEN